MNSEDMNAHAGAFAWTCCISLAYTTRSETAEWRGSSSSTLWETCQAIFQVTLSFHIPISNARGEGNWRETTERKPFAGCLCRNSSTSSADGKLCRHSQQGWQSSPFRRCWLWRYFPPFLPAPYTQGKEAVFFSFFFFLIFFLGGSRKGGSSSFLYTQNFSNTVLQNFQHQNLKVLY